jgi:hypothetical protein
MKSILTQTKKLTRPVISHCPTCHQLFITPEGLHMHRVQSTKCLENSSMTCRHPPPPGGVGLDARLLKSNDAGDRPVEEVHVLQGEEFSDHGSVDSDESSFRSDDSLVPPTPEDHQQEAEFAHQSFSADNIDPHVHHVSHTVNDEVHLQLLDLLHAFEHPPPLCAHSTSCSTGQRRHQLNNLIS